MSGRKRAWVYTHIDAPEDAHGILKQQYEKLSSYSEQLNFEVVGYSSDIGGEYTLQRPGLLSFLEEARNGNVEAVLMIDSSRISLGAAWREEFINLMKQYGIEIFFYMEGMIRSDE